jgi:hypothetical protein
MRRTLRTLKALTARGSAPEELSQLIFRVIRFVD